MGMTMIIIDEKTQTVALFADNVAADKFDMLDKKVLRSLANRPNTAGEMAD